MSKKSFTPQELHSSHDSGGQQTKCFSIQTKHGTTLHGAEQKMHLHGALRISVAVTGAAKRQIRESSGYSSNISNARQCSVAEGSRYSV